MLVQMTEIEARQEEYSETIALFGLVNALLGSLEKGARPLPIGRGRAAARDFERAGADTCCTQLARACPPKRPPCPPVSAICLCHPGPGGLEMGVAATAHYTQFVLEHVLPHLWQRGYRCGGGAGGLEASSCRHPTSRSSGPAAALHPLTDNPAPWRDRGSHPLFPQLPGTRASAGRSPPRASATARSPSTPCRPPSRPTCCWRAPRRARRSSSLPSRGAPCSRPSCTFCSRARRSWR
jgi:hypothetical protein